MIKSYQTGKRQNFLNFTRIIYSKTPGKTQLEAITQTLNKTRMPAMTPFWLVNAIEERNWDGIIAKEEKNLQIICIENLRITLD